MYIFVIIILIHNQIIRSFFRVIFFRNSSLLHLFPRTTTNKNLYSYKWKSLIGKALASPYTAPQLTATMILLHNYYLSSFLHIALLYGTLLVKNTYIYIIIRDDAYSPHPRTYCCINWYISSTPLIFHCMSRCGWSDLLTTNRNAWCLLSTAPENKP